VLSAYGWRIYALPIMLVITALVVWDTTRAPSNEARASGAPANAAVDQGTGDAPQTPDASEKPVTPIDSVNVPTADLPDGAPFTQVGKNTFRVLGAKGPKVGQGTKQTYTYTVEIEDGISAAEVGGGDDAFANLIDRTLADPRGWTGDARIAVQRVENNPVMRITLATPDTTHRVCGFAIKYESSCRSGGRVVINLARWVRGAMAFDGDIGTYRQYAINHEVGHAFGNGHRGCETNGELAPVMMQQTFGVSNDFVAKLNDAVPGSRDPVKADGKVCKKNPWPNPQGKPS
jgi:hypothetical protein